MTVVPGQDNFYRDFVDLQRRLAALEKSASGYSIITDGRFPENPYDGQGVITKTGASLSEFRYDNASAAWLQIGGTFIGQIAVSAAATNGPGWLFADGTSYLRSTYPSLFKALGGAGSPWGLADGTHFNVPDLRGRVPVGLDNQGGTDAGRLAAANTLGGSGGEEKHVLTLAEMPSVGTGFIVGGTGTAQSIATTGSGYGQVNGSDTPHNNMQPYLLIQWVIFAG